MPDLSIFGWVLLALGTFSIGIGKTAMPGLGTLSAAIFAAVIPARESTAVILLLLIAGDLLAIWSYRHDADWRTLRKLIPTVLVGIVLGALFLRWADDLMMRRAIGFILLGLTALTLFNRYRARRGVRPMANTKETSEDKINNRLARTFYGVLGGFTTMAANAGGPVMSLYFIWARFSVIRFLGTQAWFFFVVNVIKLPFSAGIGLLNLDTLRLDLVLVPLVIIGGVLGRKLARVMKQEVFDPIVIGLTIFSSLYLVIV